MSADAVGALSPAATAGINLDPGAQRKQVFKIAAVKRQVINDGVLNRAAEFRIGRLDERKVMVTVTFSVCSPGLHGEIDAQVLIDLEHDAGALGRLKALKGCPDGIRTGQEVGNVIFTGSVCGYRAGEISLRIDDVYGGAYDCAAALVGNAAFRILPALP